MKIQLPNGEKRILDTNIPLEDKLKLVEDLTSEWHETIRANWDSNSIRFFLDGLANYIVWHKEPEEKNKQDKDVLSIKKVEYMEVKRKSKCTPFSSLSVTNKEQLGISENDN